MEWMPDQLKPYSPEYEQHILQVGVVLRAYYGDRRFHNWDHAVDTRFAARRFAQQAQVVGLPVDNLAVDLGALAHDAGLYSPEAESFPTAEEYAAFIAGEVFPGFDIPADTVVTAQRSILDTHPDAKPITVEGVILRISDVMNVASPYDEMFKNFVRLILEYSETHDGQLLDLEVGRLRQVGILRKYFDHPPSLVGGHDVSGLGFDPIFTNANFNIEFLAAMPFDQLAEEFEAVAASLAADAYSSPA